MRAGAATKGVVLGMLVVGGIAAGAWSATTATAATAATRATRVTAATAATGSPAAAGLAGTGHLSVAPSVHVAGNQLVNAAGQPVRLLGVDRSGTEYACIQGWGIFDGPSDAASVAAIAAWHADAVRVPLNEDCWLGINGADPAYSGAAYRDAIASYVSLLNAAGMVAILDLHWSAPGTQQATGQQVMADATHSPAFWSSVAHTFLGDPGVVFDLYNEPHTITWTCWLHGCTVAAGWAAAGMQTLLDAVRSTGASQPVMAGGLGWSGDLSGWLAHEPVDPDHQLVASVHLYTFSGCNTASCWQSTIAPVAAQVPVVTGELGEDDCGQSFVDRYMTWADAHAISYLGWAWDAGGGWTCTNGPSLITSYAGTPTPMGAGLRDHLAMLAGVDGTPWSGAGSSTPQLGSGSATPSASSTPTPDGKGYWEVASDGGLFAFGDAGFYGSMGGKPLNAPIVGLAPTPDGKGYWEVASDGGLFAFGDAGFYGSMGGKPLNAPVVGLAPTPDGKGYWEVASDGGLFAFGDAGFYGSMGGKPLDAPIVGIAPTPDGKGYWEVASDGGLFAFGDAGFYGSMGGKPLDRPIVGITPI